MSHAQSHTLKGAFIPRSTFYNSPFGRLFGKLPAWVPPGNSENQKEQAIKAFSKNEMFEPDPLPSPDPFENPSIPAGYTYFGQFVDHDITFDPTSSLMRMNDPNRLRNFRTPRLDLDCVYGAGPGANPHLYEKKNFGHFLIDKGAEGVSADLPRNSQGVALIGDPRNDENSIVAQIQLTFLRLHNRILNAITGGTMADGEQFEEAQRLVRWFYQFVVWNDFVKRIVADNIHRKALKAEDGLLNYNGCFYRWKDSPYIPVEFSVAAYRFGHSMVRPGYQMNNPFLGFGNELPIFRKGGAGDDLRGGRKINRNHLVQWDWFLKLPSSNRPFPQASRKIDTKLSSSVFKIPDAGNNPLAKLNLQRSWRMELAKGTAVAKAMGVAPLSLNDPMEDALWVYILKEAETLPGSNGGAMLGKVGGTIVAEVFAGLLSGDPFSYVNSDPQWNPAEIDSLFGLGGPISGQWEFADIIKTAEMPLDDADVLAFITP